MLSLVLSLGHLPLLDSNPVEKNSESKPRCRRKDAKIKIRDFAGMLAYASVSTGWRERNLAGSQ